MAKDIKEKLADEIIGTKIESMHALPCAAQTFTIKGKSMFLDDFGQFESDECPEGCECMGCHNKHFVCYGIKTIKAQIDNKIKLTNEELNEICETLEDVFYVGDCGWCS
jgi:hypothetical protein